jgi:hypothetical protein
LKVAQGFKGKPGTSVPSVGPAQVGLLPLTGWLHDRVGRGPCVQETGNVPFGELGVGLEGNAGAFLRADRAFASLDLACP